MIYEVIKGETTFRIDDNIFFDKQPKAFRKAYEENKECDVATFDNVTVMVLPNNRVIITEIEKGGEDE